MPNPVIKASNSLKNYGWFLVVTSILVVQGMRAFLPLSMHAIDTTKHPRKNLLFSNF
jgi:hypothetical protein